MTSLRAITLGGLSWLALLSSPPGQATEPGIEWLVDCPKLPGRGLDQEVIARTQCGIVTVPLDHQGSAPGRVRLSITRVGARLPLARKGVVFTQSGTPHTNAHGIFAVHLATVWKYANTEAYRSLTNLYDVIELSPRKQPATAQSAWDMEFVRLQLGEEKINYLGTAQGTGPGLGYGALFSHRVGRMVLIEPALDELSDDLVHMAFAQLPAERRLVLKGPYLRGASSKTAGQCTNRWAGDYLANGTQPPRASECLVKDQ
ncbi:alpha/beta fold hydrolase [Pseudomonas mucidolens]|uniref:alpha/beta fold hydrolase n=1 Tax=Pseudomonas mucidolens TaxID=46679 RepID=UPI0030DDB78C